MATRVSSEFFNVLGVAPALGRTFFPEDNRAGAEPVAVLSNGLWKRRFGSDPHIIGKTCKINGAPARIVGVMPASFRFPEDSNLWMPLALDESLLTKSPSPSLHRNRSSETRRSSRASSRGNAIARQSDRCPEQRRRSQLDLVSISVPRASGGARSTSDPSSILCRRLRTADRLRERRQSSARTSRRSFQGNRRTHCVGCQQISNRQPIAHRERSTRDYRFRPRLVSRKLGAARHHSAQSRRCPATAGRLDRLARIGIYFAGHRTNWRLVWSRAGAASFQGRSAKLSPRIASRLFEFRPTSSAQRAGCLRNCPGAYPAGGRGFADQQFCAPAPRTSRLQSAETTYSAIVFAGSQRVRLRHAKQPSHQRDPRTGT